jgi:hypothetical protein
MRFRPYSYVTVVVSSTSIIIKRFYFNLRHRICPEKQLFTTRSMLAFVDWKVACMKTIGIRLLMRYMSKILFTIEFLPSIDFFYASLSQYLCNVAVDHEHAAYLYEAKCQLLMYASIAILKLFRTVCITCLYFIRCISTITSFSRDIDR